MTIQEMKERKKELGYSNQQIADLSGIPLGTVQKIFSGATASPRHDTLAALERLLAPRKSTWDFSHTDSMISEPALEYSVRRSEESPDEHAGSSNGKYLYLRQGSYTVEDYFNLPEDQRAELIDGVFYDLNTPAIPHQLIGGFIFHKLLSHVFEKGGTCLPMVSPISVQLDCDDKTMVQPDVLIVCDRDKLKHRCVYGAPDFVIEVLSPSTRRRDLSLKLQKYQNAGVREYWIIDPDKQKVMVYDLEHDEFPVIYGFDAKVPVLVWDGECVIDFAEVYEHIRFMYEN